MRCTKSAARAALASLCMWAAATAQAADNTQYENCLARAQSDPVSALSLSASWSRSGGAAEHCAALALITLRRFSEAAQKLDALSRSAFAATGPVRAALLAQAGNAWLLGSRPDNAIVSFSGALAIDPLDADVLSDRARANAFKKNWAKAESDLTAALLVAPGRADLLVLRGSARHAMGRVADARIDFDRALRLQPRNPDALVERGAMKFEAGDIAGARSDWQQVVANAPGSAAAESARQHLADSASAPTQP